MIGCMASYFIHFLFVWGNFYLFIIYSETTGRSRIYLLQLRLSLRLVGIDWICKVSSRNREGNIILFVTHIGFLFVIDLPPCSTYEQFVGFVCIRTDCLIC